VELAFAALPEEPGWVAVSIREGRFLNFRQTSKQELDISRQRISDRVVACDGDVRGAEKVGLYHTF
jgi:hypothetical protein